MNKCLLFCICLFPWFLQASENFLVFLVDAKHLDYSNTRSFFKSVAKHPKDWSKNGDVGHAWIYVQGKLNGTLVAIEGGHSGEFGQFQPKYFEGVMEGIEKGEKNPIQYLWTTQQDGIFEYGGGYHQPSYAVKVELSQDQFDRIAKFIRVYCYKDYAITGNQCASFVTQIAALIDWNLDCEITMKVDREVIINGEKLILWDNPQYEWMTFGTPDVLELSLKRIVKEGRGQCALAWYYQHRKRTLSWRLSQIYQSIQAFPRRFLYYLML